MKIIIQTIPPEQQRYETVGDWQWLRTGKPDPETAGLEGNFWPETDTLVISISQMKDWRHQALVAIHELTEALLCKYGDVSEEQVDNFDLSYQGPYSEPGSDPRAPYWHEHSIANRVESLLSGNLEVDWDQYQKDCEQALSVPSVRPVRAPRTIPRPI